MKKNSEVQRNNKTYNLLRVFRRKKIIFRRKKDIDLIFLMPRYITRYLIQNKNTNTQKTQHQKEEKQTNMKQVQIRSEGTRVNR